MKLTIFGLTITSSWGNGHATPYRAIVRALHRRGFRVVFYEKDVEYYSLRRDFTRSEHCEVVLYREWAEVRERALRDAADSDVVITASYCPEGAAINDEVLELARPLHVFYDLDTPITLSNLMSGDVPYLRQDQVPQFDLVLSWTAGKSLTDLEQRWGARMARPLFGCVDPDVYTRTKERPDFKCELSYMGTYAADRQRKVDELFLEAARRHSDRRFLLAGTLYPRQWQWPENVQRFDHVSPENHAALYSSSRLTLNITREDMAETGWCPSGRFFEAAACGTPILSDWWEGLDRFFKPGEEIVIVRNSEDVERALAMAEPELQRMAAGARERTLSENTGAHRVDELLNYCEEARSSGKGLERKAGPAGERGIANATGPRDKWPLAEEGL